MQTTFDFSHRKLDVGQTEVYKGKVTWCTESMQTTFSNTERTVVVFQAFAQGERKTWSVLVAFIQVCTRMIILLRLFCLKNPLIVFSLLLFVVEIAHEVPLPQLARWYTAGWTDEKLICVRQNQYPNRLAGVFIFLPWATLFFLLSFFLSVSNQVNQPLDQRWSVAGHAMFIADLRSRTLDAVQSFYVFSFLFL